MVYRLQEVIDEFKYHEEIPRVKNFMDEEDLMAIRQKRKPISSGNLLCVDLIKKVNINYLL
jgi:hypothetical protein